MMQHFAHWQESCLENTRAKERARIAVHEFAQQSPEFLALCKVRQSPPHHAEGREVRDHLMRALTFLFALQEGASLLEIDEWHAQKHLEGFFDRLEKVCKAEKSILLAYILTHDIGKIESAFEEGGVWHYREHAIRSAEQKYASFREQALVYAQCQKAEGKLLRELIRIHMQVIMEATQKKETQIMRIAYAVAEKQGINAERFLALLPAAFLFDAILGSKSAEESAFESSQHIVRYAESEYENFPQRKEDDDVRIKRKEKESYKKLLEEYGLGNDEWFFVLNTPYGKERGKVVKILERFIKEQEDDDDVRYIGREHAHELRMRVRAMKEKQK